MGDVENFAVMPPSSDVKPILLDDISTAPGKDEGQPPAKKRRIAQRPVTQAKFPEIDQCVLLADEKLTLYTESSNNDDEDDIMQNLEDQDVLVTATELEPNPNEETLVSLTLHDSNTFPHRSFRVRLPHPNERSHSRKLLQTLLHTRHMPQRSEHTVLKETDVYWAEYILLATSFPHHRFDIHLKIFWRIDVNPALRGNKKAAAQDVLSFFCDHDRPREPLEPFQPQDFYASVHAPPTKSTSTVALSDRLGLECQLYPFQTRALEWLLHREGVQVNKDGEVERLPSSVTQLPTSFELRQDCNGKSFHVSHILPQAKWQIKDQEARVNVSGGILAEEMGLGKTVELIALIMSHQREGNLEPFLDEYTGLRIKPAKATLIITPPAILEQWMNELHDHAPGLNVLYYEGLRSSKLSEKRLLETLLQHDVVLTTYQVLAREIHYANEKPPRDLRHAKIYKPPRSPLVQVHWWRVCLDEAQMIESGVSNAAKVARLIPRCNAWAVSGTPLKKDVMDLLGLLIFLRYEPFCDHEVWKSLVASQRSLLQDIFNRLTLRHTKAKIRDELVLPPQKRMVITVPFTATEEQNYNNLFKQMCDECGLNLDGSPLDGYWDPQSPSIIEKMRMWLTRLRQTCLHAEIGSRNRRALGNRHGPLRTVDEVLQVMIDQNEAELRSKERDVLLRKVTRGHIHSFGKESQQALDLYLESLEEAKRIVSECRQQLESEKVRVALRKEAAAESSNDHFRSETEDSEDDEEDGEAKRGRLGACRLHLRSALEILHVCYFFAGTAYFQVKDDKALTEPDSEAFQDLEKREVECYEEAKLVRRELLRHVSRRTTRLVEKVVEAKEKSFLHFTKIPEFQAPAGLESRKVTENIDKLREMLNDQAEHFEEWRLKLVDSLLERLIDHDDDVEMTGEEYELTTKKQDEQYVFLEALRCVQSDRQCMLTGQVGSLINHEMKSAQRQATDGAPEDPANKGPAPELMMSLINERKAFNPPDNIRATNTYDALRLKPLSLRGIMTDIRHVITAVQWNSTDRGKMETLILERELHNLQNIAQTQQKQLSSMQSELDLLRSTMNQRLEYYRQLQQLSDMVAPYQEELGNEVDHTRLAEQQRLEDSISIKLSGLKTKRRFLTHLKATESTDKEEQKLCVICQSTFQTGLLTVCGHQFCKDCIRMWWSEHRTCPMCKTYLKGGDFHEVTYKPQELRAREEANINHQEQEEQVTDTKASPTKPSIYSSINPGTLHEIQNIDLPSSQSFGVKIDTIARHLLWLRQSDPGSKTVLFSQYRDFLNVLGQAFQCFGVMYTEVRRKMGIKNFRDNPNIECFLLDAKAESSGLTLVNATHVILCEPLINTAIELQAIARVHRIGQRRPTTVWMYLVSNTVEEAIYDISVERRMSHIQKSTSASAPASRQLSRAATPAANEEKSGVEESKLDAANSLELQSAPLSQLMTKGSSGGEVVAKDDLWSCLFSGRTNTAVDSIRGALGLSGAGGLIAEATEREMGRFLRAEAAENRQNQSSREPNGPRR